MCIGITRLRATSTTFILRSRRNRNGDTSFCLSGDLWAVNLTFTLIVWVFISLNFKPILFSLKLLLYVHPLLITINSIFTRLFGLLANLFVRNSSFGIGGLSKGIELVSVLTSSQTWELFLTVEVAVSTEGPHGVPVHFLSVWWTRIGHRDIGLALNWGSSWWVFWYSLVARVCKTAVGSIGASHLLLSRFKHWIDQLGGRASKSVTLFHVGLTLRSLQWSLMRIPKLCIILLLSLVKARIRIYGLVILNRRLASFLHFLVQLGFLLLHLHYLRTISLFLVFRWHHVNLVPLPNTLWGWLG